MLISEMKIRQKLQMLGDLMKELISLFLLASASLSVFAQKSAVNFAEGELIVLKDRVSVVSYRFGGHGSSLPEIKLHGNIVYVPKLIEARSDDPRHKSFVFDTPEDVFVIEYKGVQKSW